MVDHKKKLLKLCKSYTKVVQKTLLQETKMPDHEESSTRKYQSQRRLPKVQPCREGKM
jgi:hypothetical protein